MKNVLVFLGGQSPEHEVSIITGLQIFEHIDRNIYNPIPIFISEKGGIFELDQIKNRKDFSLSQKTKIHFEYDEEEKVTFLITKNKRVSIYAAINTLHGGAGESGSMAGFLGTYQIPYTSSNVESSVLCMNKALTKEQVSKFAIPTIPWVLIQAKDIKENVKTLSTDIQDKLGLPVIVKPCHLGSSIGIKIARESTALELALLEASHLDTEILVEKFVENISEYNCSVRKVEGLILASEVEKPLPKEEILSFSEKYQNGGKKMIGGMASLIRELPAEISSDLSQRIKKYSTEIYKILKCSGVARIDFIQSESGELFFNEINPIPGSMAYYLWETVGIPFKQQISELIEECVDIKQLSTHYVHKTDIIEKFIKSYKY